MDMQEFKRRKAELLDKWGDKLLGCTVAEYVELHKDVEPLCKFAKMRPEKMINGMAQAYLRGER